MDDTPPDAGSCEAHRSMALTMLNMSASVQYLKAAITLAFNYRAMADVPDFGDDALADMERMVQNRIRNGSIPNGSRTYYDLESGGGGASVGQGPGLSSLARRPKRAPLGSLEEGLELSDISDDAAASDRADDDGDEPDAPKRKKSKKPKKAPAPSPSKKKQNNKKIRVHPHVGSIIRDNEDGYDHHYAGYRVIKKHVSREEKAKQRQERRAAAEAAAAEAIERGEDPPEEPPSDERSGEDDESSESEVEYFYIRERSIRAPDHNDNRELFQSAPKPPWQCVGCTHFREDCALPGFEKMQSMARLFNTKMTNSHRATLSKALAIFYKVNIQDEANSPHALQEGETPMPDWDAPTIHEHFTRHVLEFGCRRTRRMEMIDNIIEQLYVEEAWRERETRINSGTFRPLLNRQATKDLRDWLKLEAQLFGQDARRAMFSSAGIGLPSEEARSMMNVQKGRVRVKNAARITGTSSASQGSNAGVGGTIQGAGAGGTTRSNIAGTARPRTSGWGS